MKSTWPTFSAVALLLSWPASAFCQTQPSTRHEQGPSWAPSSVFIQAGHAPASDTLALGLTWDWRWRKTHALGTVTGLWEVSASQWRVDDTAPGRSDSVTQVGIVPALRLYPTRWSPGWFVEGGIGVAHISPRYQTRTKEFGTEFNFSEHLALGRRLGDRHEISLRSQHFSNAGIKQPNPGESFLQLRYAYVF